MENTLKYKELGRYQVLDTSIVIDTINKELTYKTPHFDYDFNLGFRIKFNNCDCKYSIIVMDKHTREVISKVIFVPEENTVYQLHKKYFIDCEIRIFKVINDAGEPYPLKVISFDIQNKDILVLIASDRNPAGLGDSIAWMTAAYQFKLKHPDTNVYIHMAYPDLEEIFKLKYSEYFNFVTYSEIKDRLYYATYLCGCFFDDVDLKFRGQYTQFLNEEDDIDTMEVIGSRANNVIISSAPQSSGMGDMSPISSLPPQVPDYDPFYGMPDSLPMSGDNGEVPY